MIADDRAVSTPTRVVWVLGALGITLAAFVVFAYYAVMPDLPTKFRVDDARMQASRKHLDALRQELDSLSVPRATTSDPAEASGCYLDSGDLRQPSASRRWAVLDSDASKARASIAKQLEAKNWVVSRKTERDTIILTRELADTSAQAQVFTQFGHAGVVVFVDITPCSI